MDPRTGKPSRRKVLLGLAGLGPACFGEPQLTDCLSSDPGEPYNVPGLACREVRAAGMTYRLYRSPIKGPAILVLHELPGLYQEDIDLAGRFTEAGFTAYVPLFFGKPRDFHPIRYGLTRTVFPWSQFPALYPNHTPKVARWLNELLPLMHQECGGKGVGAIGMCLTGTLPLALAASGIVRAVVLCQPTMPLLFGSSLDLSKDDVRDAHNKAVDILALKFSKDGKSPDARWKTLREKFKGHFHELIVRSGDGSSFGGGSHSVLGHGYGQDESATHEAFRRVVRFFDNRVSDQPKLPPYPGSDQCTPDFVSCKSY